MVDYVDSSTILYRVFSLPTTFNHLTHITNNNPTIVFNSVTRLELNDTSAFDHEFFVRLAQTFPFLESLSIRNTRPPLCGSDEYGLQYKGGCSSIEYSHLTFLDVRYAIPYYIESFLKETKINLPRLTKL